MPNRMKMKQESLLVKIFFKRVTSLPAFLKTALFFAAREGPPTRLGPRPTILLARASIFLGPLRPASFSGGTSVICSIGSTPSAMSMARNISMVKVGGGALLNLAILCSTAIASASRPLLRRNLGDSWKRNTKYRRKKMNRVMPPSTIRLYRQPMLLSTVQQASPSFTALHEGKSGPQRYLAVVP